MSVGEAEVNFGRLLARCEGMAAEKRFGEWRFDVYVASLEEMLVQISHLPARQEDESEDQRRVFRPPADVLAAYKKKVEFLRNLATTEKLTKANEKARASAQLLGGSQAGPARAAAADQSAGKTSQLQMTAKARLDEDLRHELFGGEGKEDEQNEGRDSEKGSRGGMTSDDLDQVMQHHRNAQEKIAEDMLAMARHLKESTSAAGRVVRDDVSRIQSSARIADSNLSKLQVQSKRLEAHVKKFCDWWVWISLLCVCVTFVMMVLFMKLFKKRTY